MSDEDKDSEDMNQKIVRIGGTALLLTSVITSATVAIGKNQIAQRAAKKGEAVDVAAMNEGSQMAMRALKRATMYNIIGFGGVIGLGCLYFNIRSFQDFRSVIKRCDQNANKLNLNSLFQR